MPASSYKLVARKGQGGMAEVFKAVKSGPDGFSKTVALKKILPTHSDQTHFIRMLSTEAKIHSYLSHPNIIQILDFFEEGGQYSMVLEYVDGKNVKEILEICRQRNQPLPWQACLFIMIEILKGLQYAHTKDGSSGPLNIVHRDVSPHNILISYEGEVKLSDFGIARAQIERDETASGVLKGKYRYLSPEQVLNEKIEQASDLFSAGVTLYEMLSLQHPFGELQEYQTLQKIVDKPHTPLKKVLPSLKPEISHVIDQALQKNPKDRHQNARDFYEDLLDIQDPSWITHGHELLATLLGNILPVEARTEEPIEKTSVMGTSIFAQNSYPKNSNHQYIWSDMKIIGGIFLTIVLAGIIGLTSNIFQKKQPENIAKTPPSSQPIMETSSESIAPNKKIAKSIKSKGALLIEGPAKTQVYINGKNMGQLPIASQSLAPGSYNVLLDRGDLGRQLNTIQVVPKETTITSWK